MNQELPDVQPRFRKGRGTKDQISNIRWIVEKGIKKKKKKKSLYLCFIDYAKAFDCGIITDCGMLLKRWDYPTILPVSWETCMWVKKQELEPYMEQLTGSGLRKEYNRAVCCHPVYLTYTLSASWEMLGWVSYKLELR